jgi:cytochrome b561
MREALSPGERPGEHPLPQRHRGQYSASIAYRGVYRVFLAIPSVGFVLSRTAAMWTTYHSTGAATIEEATDHSAVLVVRGAEAIQKAMVEVVTGHVLALAELTRAREPLVHGDGKNPAELRWIMRWK